MSPQMILVAGPYRSGTNDDSTLIARNVEAMTETSLQLFRIGHSQVMDEWCALPLIEHAGSTRIGNHALNETLYPILRRRVAGYDAVFRISSASASANEMVSLALETEAHQPIARVDTYASATLIRAL